MEFKDRLKSLRLKNGITQKELGTTLNVSRSSISLYELGYSMPSREVLDSLAKYFNVSLKYLLNGQEACH